MYHVVNTLIYVVRLCFLSQYDKWYNRGKVLMRSKHVHVLILGGNKCTGIRVVSGKLHPEVYIFST